MTARFAVGDKVRVREAYPPGHVRTPYFIRGKQGRVTRVIGAYANPEELAYGRKGLPKQALYWIQFSQSALWPDYRGGAHDSAVVDVYEHWLEPAGGRKK
jgi:nitrile hydratase subunit beta